MQVANTLTPFNPILATLFLFNIGCGGEGGFTPLYDFALIGEYTVKNVIFDAITLLVIRSDLHKINVILTVIIIVL